MDSTTLRCCLTVAVLIWIVESVHPREGERSLEFITQNYISDYALVYGLKLLEDIHQVRMACQERRDKMEQEWTSDLQIWTKYSIQTRQAIEYFDRDNENTMKQIIHNTYMDMESSRKQKLKVIESQCDKSLEELLMQRKLTLLKLSYDFMTRNTHKLVSLIEELMKYKTQLQDGLAECITIQATHYEHGISSKLQAPEEFCLSTDINILISFLERMQKIIAMEQQHFFGDDEDLGNEVPCGVSGCQEYKPDTITPTLPTHVTDVTTDVNIAANTERSLPTPTEKTTGDTNNNSDGKDEVQLKLLVTPALAETPHLKEVGKQNETLASLASTEMLITTEPSHAENTASISEVSTDDKTSNRPNKTEHDDTTQESTSYPHTFPPTTHALSPPEPKEEPVSDIPQTIPSKDGNYLVNIRNKGKSRPLTDHDHSDTYITKDATEKETEDDSSANAINPALTYSFIVVCTALILAIVTVVVATMIVHRRRRQLLASKVYVTHKQIATMKETGYVNPSYNLLDGEND